MVGLADGAATPAAPDPRVTSLGAREHKVLVAIGRGWTNALVTPRS
ncbi:hypothetical protein [Streptomyces sp. NPDC051001]